MHAARCARCGSQCSSSTQKPPRQNSSPRSSICCRRTRARRRGEPHDCRRLPDQRRAALRDCCMWIAHGRLVHALAYDLSDVHSRGRCRRRERCSNAAGKSERDSRTHWRRRRECAWRAAIRWIPQDVQRFNAVVFGAGDHRTRTEDRPLPPVVASGRSAADRHDHRSDRGAARSSPALCG